MPGGLWCLAVVCASDYACGVLRAFRSGSSWRTTS